MNDKRTCAICGDPVRSALGICRRTPDCGRAYQRATYANYTPERKQEMRELARVREAKPERRENHRARDIVYRAEMPDEKREDMLRKHRERAAALRQREPLGGLYRSIRSRCGNPNNTQYMNYGARGIRLCDRWQVFENFKAGIEAEIGPRPEGKYPSGMPLYTLDRIDNDGNYEPGNVRWATSAEQHANSRARIRNAQVTALLEENAQLRAELAKVRQAA